MCMSASVYIQHMDIQPCTPVLEHGETKAGALAPVLCSGGFPSAFPCWEPGSSMATVWIFSYFV